MEQNKRFKITKIQAYVSIIINFIIFIVKLLIAISSGSLAILSDAIHSLSDNISSLLILIFAKLSIKEPDSKHPFGHSRFEIISSLILAFLLFFVAFEIGRSGVLNILNPTDIKINTFQLIVILITMIFKEFLAQFSFFLGKKIGSDVLLSDGWHHRSDAMSTIPVFFVILFHKRIPWIDGAVSILIALFLLLISIRLIIKNIDRFLGNAPDPRYLERIKMSISDLEDILGIHDISIHNYGNIRIITLHIEIDQNIELNKAHNLSENVELFLKEKFSFSDVIVHIDPVDTDNTEIFELKSEIENILGDPRAFTGVFGIRIYGENWKNVYFELIPDKDAKHGRLIAEKYRIIKHLKKIFPGYHTINCSISNKFNF